MQRRMCASGQEKVTVEERGIQEDVCSPLPVCPLSAHSVPRPCPQSLPVLGPRSCQALTRLGGRLRMRTQWGSSFQQPVPRGVCMAFQGRRGLCDGGVRPGLSWASYSLSQSSY